MAGSRRWHATAGAVTQPQPQLVPAAAARPRTAWADVAEGVCVPLQWLGASWLFDLSGRRRSTGRRPEERTPHETDPVGGWYPNRSGASK
jgi:hypothetical protein